MWRETAYLGRCLAGIQCKWERATSAREIESLKRRNYVMLAGILLGKEDKAVMRHIVYLALGTNLGDRLANLQEALQALAPKMRVLKASPVYETEPWGVKEQPMFLNQVICAETDLAPFALLDFLKGLEKRLGRQPGILYGPRLIDLDILFYDDLVLEAPPLTIPHPRMLGRAFVLAPLADLAPDFVHPKVGRTVSQLLAECDLSGVHPYEQEGAA